MGELVSLSNARKNKARETHRKQGDANAAKFGQTLSERRAEAAERDRLRRELDGKRKE